MADLFEKAELQAKRKEQRILAAQKMKEEKEMAECTFSPTINNPKGPLEPEQVEELSQRLHDDVIIYHNRRQKKLDQQHKKECPFSPKTNRVKDPDEEVDADAVSQKLFDEANLKAKRLQIVARRHAKAECPFTPKTNYSKDADAEPTDTEALSARLYDEAALKMKRLEKKTKDVVKATCTFQPKLKSKPKNGRKGEEEDELDPEHVAKTVDRLYEDAALHKVRNANRFKALLKAEAKNNTYQPKTNREPEELEDEERRQKLEESIERLYQEAKMNEDRRAKKHKERAKLEARTCTFKPQLDKELLNAQIVRAATHKANTEKVLAQPSPRARAMSPPVVPTLSGSPRTFGSPNSQPQSPLTMGSGWASPRSPLMRTYQTDRRSSRASTDSQASGRSQ
eukprot:TRINITY_DN68299_c0_g1_i1.p1 TRINITY_DN68299_c0_g1~~TRINITY_DN68299_c0_g1_i1.p1  ORF type:complete len:397 (+),score=58.38 TRINITY_DN68299_c0_g1_i1:48-1238(+)